MPVLPFALRYVGIILLLLSFYWFMSSKEIEAALTFIGFLTAFIAQDAYFANKAKVLERSVAKDQKVFENLLEIIRPDNELWFLKHQDHGDGFYDASIENFLKFADGWNTVDKEFIDPGLETLRKKLHKIATEYAHKVAWYTFYIDKSHKKLSDELYERDPDAWDAQRTELNALADEVAEAFELLVREARMKL